MNFSDIIKFIILFSIAGLFIFALRSGYFESVEIETPHFNLEEKIPEKYIQFFQDKSEVLLIISFLLYFFIIIHLNFNQKRLREKIVKIISNTVGPVGLEEIYRRLKGRESLGQKIQIALTKFQWIFISRGTFSNLETKIIDILAMEENWEKKSLEKIFVEINLNQVVKDPMALKEIEKLLEENKKKRRFYMALAIFLFLITIATIFFIE